MPDNVNALTKSKQGRGVKNVKMLMLILFATPTPILSTLAVLMFALGTPKNYEKFSTREHEDHQNFLITDFMYLVTDQLVLMYSTCISYCEKTEKLGNVKNCLFRV